MPGRFDGREPLDERVHELALLEHRIRTGLPHRLVQLRVRIARERDQAEVRMVLAQPRDRAHTVEQRHVQVDHDGVGQQLVRELDRVQPVLRSADDCQLGLVLDQRLEGLEEGCVVVREQHTDRSLTGSSHRPDVSLAPVAVQQVAVIGAPLDLGQGRRGVDMGPSAIRYAELAEHLQQKLGIATQDYGNVPAPVPEAAEERDTSARYLPEILQYCDEIAQLVARARNSGATPLVLGGDHSVALGTLVGMAGLHGPGGAIWIDAHGDLNTPETSPTGNVHGMVLAAALGLGGDAFRYDEWTMPTIAPGKLALIGVRSLDKGERSLLGSLDAKVFTMSEVDRLGTDVCMREAIAHASGAGFLHVSLDMDVVDPDKAPGVGTPVDGGLSYREAHLAMEIVAESGLADSFDVVEVNPILDRENATGRLAVELVASALGSRIL
jgi:arginase